MVEIKAVRTDTEVRRYSVPEESAKLARIIRGEANHAGSLSSDDLLDSETKREVDWHVYIDGQEIDLQSL